MAVLSYSLPLALDVLMMSMLPHPSTTIPCPTMISIKSNTLPAPIAAIRDQQDVRKIVLEQRNTRLASSPRNQLNQLIFFYLLVEEFCLSIKTKLKQLLQ